MCLIFYVGLFVRLSVYISHLCSVFSSVLSEFCVCLGQIVILFTSGVNLIPLIPLTVRRCLLMWGPLAKGLKWSFLQVARHEDQ